MPSGPDSSRCYTATANLQSTKSPRASAHELFPGATARGNSPEAGGRRQSGRPLLQRRRRRPYGPVRRRSLDEALSRRRHVYRNQLYSLHMGSNGYLTLARGRPAPLVGRPLRCRSRPVPIQGKASLCRPVRGSYRGLATARLCEKLLPTANRGGCVDTSVAAPALRGHAPGRPSADRTPASEQTAGALGRSALSSLCTRPGGQPSRRPPPMLAKVAKQKAGLAQDNPLLTGLIGLSAQC